MSCSPLARTAPLLVPALATLALVAACSSPAPAPAGVAAPASSSGPSTPPSTPPSSAATTPPPSTGPGPSSAGGTIRFTGAISGSMAMFACHEGGPAQLVVTIDGEQRTYNGVIDAEDFSFLGPGKSGWTLAEGTRNPEVSGGTYTVRKTKLVGVFDDRTITADGSVTCP